jgi:hypothetical protein
MLKSSAGDRPAVRIGNAATQIVAAKMCADGRAAIDPSCRSMYDDRHTLARRVNLTFSNWQQSDNFISNSTVDDAIGID